MDQQFIDREKELFKLNAKLNAKSKKIAQPMLCLPVRPQKTIQVHTANNNLNYYDETQLKDGQIVEEQFELMCKKINITNQPTRKAQEIAYPFFSRQTSKLCRRVDIHMPTGSLLSDGKADEFVDMKSIRTDDMAADPVETSTVKNESMITRHSDDTSAVPPCTMTVVETLLNKQLPPAPIATDIIPKCIEKKISNDGLLKFLKSKVALLQTELESSKNLNDTLEKENVKQSKKIKKLTGLMDKANIKIESLETSLNSLQEKHTSAEQGLKDKDATIAELNREISTMKEELRELNHNNQVMEKKMLKSQEDHDMMKSKYESYKDIEIIMRESSKEERLAYEEKIRKLRKGRLDLLKAYKQQIILIDNLRRQNVCLEKSKALEIAEKEFLKVLDWNFTDK